MRHTAPQVVTGHPAGCPYNLGNSIARIGGEDVLTRIWRKLVALNHCRDIYGEDTLVTQGIQLAVGLLTSYGILKFIGLWDAVFH